MTENDNRHIAIGLAIGVAIGVALKNIAVGIGVGLGVGLLLRQAKRAHLDRQERDDEAEPGEDGES